MRDTILLRASFLFRSLALCMLGCPICSWPSFSLCTSGVAGICLLSLVSVACENKCSPKETLWSWLGVSLVSFLSPPPALSASFQIFAVLRLVCFCVCVLVALCLRHLCVCSLSTSVAGCRRRCNSCRCPGNLPATSADRFLAHLKGLQQKRPCFSTNTSSREVKGCCGFVH
jgi:hypothetical protein